MVSLSQLLTLTGRSNSESDYHAAMVGLVLSMLAMHPTVASRSVGWHYHRLVRALELEQVKLYFDRFGRCSGYIWWTHASAELEAALLKSGPEGLDAADFSTSGEAWIVDLRANLGELTNILLDLRDTLQGTANTLTYFRYKRGKRIAKRITADDRVPLLWRKSPPSERAELAWLCSDKGRSALESMAANLQGAIDRGKALGLLTRLPRYAELPLPAMLKRLGPSLENRQYRLLCSPTGEPKGFCSWAWREAAEIPMDKPLHALEAYEWHDGRDALLCDAAATRGNIGDLRRELSTIASVDWLIYPDVGNEKEPAGSLRRISKRELLTMPAPQQEVCDLVAWWRMANKRQTCAL